MEIKQNTKGANKKSYIFALISVLSIFAMGQVATSYMFRSISVQLCLLSVLCSLLYIILFLQRKR